MDDDVLNVATFAISLADGRVLPPASEPVSGVDMTHPHNQALLDEGLLLVMDPAPKDPRTIVELRAQAKELGLPTKDLTREQLLDAIAQAEQNQETTS